MVCVAPPHGRPAPKLDPRSLGKIPARYRPSTRDWIQVGVQHHACPDQHTAQDWDRAGANVGLACGRAWNLVFVDLDFDDPDYLSDTIAILRRHFGQDIPIRGVDNPNHARAGVAFRLDQMPRGAVLRFQDPMGNIFKLEILGENRQFVAWGQHRDTKAPYAWAKALQGPDDFPLIDIYALRRVLIEIELELSTKYGIRRIHGGSGTVSHTRPAGDAGEILGSEEEVTRYLNLIPNDHHFADYDAWLHMGLALINASGGAAWGKALWMAWSNQVHQDMGENYPARKWDENLPSSPNGPLGLWWLRKEAQARAPGTLAVTAYDTAPLDETEVDLTAAAIKGEPLWPGIFAEWAYLPTQQRFFRWSDRQLYPERGFNAVYQRVLPLLKTEAGITARTKDITPAWLYFNDIRQVFVQNLIYHPGEKRLITTRDKQVLANTWAPGFSLTHPGVSEFDVRQFLDHAKLVLRSDANVRRFIVWCAYVLQFPDRKPNWGWLVSTMPGLGKDALLFVLRWAVGNRNHISATVQMLHGSFTDYLERKLITVSETHQQTSEKGKSSADVYNQLKEYLARPPEEIMINHKNQKPYSIPNLSAWFFLSNHHKPIYLEPGDRRLFVIDNTDTPKQTTDYYVRLWAYLEADKNLIASFLLTYPLTAADIQLIEGPAPASDAKVILISANQHPLETAVADYIDELKLTVAQTGIKGVSLVTTASEIKDSVLGRSGFKSTSDAKLAQALWNAGARPVRPDPRNPRGAASIWAKGSSKRLWLLAPRDAKGRDYTWLSEDQLVDLYGGSRFPLDIADADVKVVKLHPTKDIDV
jgi:Family of unknown function (DUF5906)/Bifunctional DNA primase/polymerase, N-terminal/Primase C terminal 2 (PriCT-2)